MSECYRRCGGHPTDLLPAEIEAGGNVYKPTVVVRSAALGRIAFGGLTLSTGSARATSIAHVDECALPPPRALQTV